MIRVLIASLMLTFSQYCFPATWTGFGIINEIVQQPASVGADYVIEADLPENPTSCVDKARFHLSVVTKRDERTVAILLSAFMAGKQVRVYVTDSCHAWGVPEISGVLVKH